MTVAKILYKSFYWKIFQFSASLLINIIFARAFQSVIAAEFYSIVYLMSLGVSFFTLGLDIGLNYFLSRKQVPPGAAAGIILIVTALALLVCLPLLAVYYQPGRYPDVPFDQFLFFGACSIAGGLLTVLSGTLFTSFGRNYIPVKITFFVNGVIALVSLVSILFFSRSRIIENLFLLYFISSFLQGLFLFVYACRCYGSPGPGSLANGGKKMGIRELFRFSFSAFMTNFLFFAGSRACLYLIPYHLPLVEQGNFIQAYKIVEYTGVVVAFIYYPFVALVAEDQEKMKDRVFTLVRLSNSFVFLFSLLILATGWWLFPFVFGSSFDRMYGVFICLIPGLFALCASTYFTAFYFGSGRLKYNFFSSCIQLLSMLAFFFLFINIWGAKGAALAFSLASLLSLIFDLVLFKKIFPFKTTDMLFIRRSDLHQFRLFFLSK